MASQSLGAQIKALREQRRWSQETLAAKLDVSTKTISNWERGRNDPRSSVGALNKLFGVDLEAEDDLPEESDDEAPAQLPPGVRPVGDPSDELVEFRVSGAFGVQAVVRGPVRDIDALQAAVSRLIAGMRAEEADEA